MEKTLTSTSKARYLSCFKCGKRYDIHKLQYYAACCNQPFITHYNLDFPLTKTELSKRESSMWRYREMLPLFDETSKVSLGEGMTPILPLKKLASSYGLHSVLMKDEGQNPSGSFKARGLSMAVSKAKELGVSSCIIPTAGNAGGALSAYCAAAGMEATVVMPLSTPNVFKEECELHGARLLLVDGLIDVCGQKVKEIQQLTHAFNVATMKEPYRLEGKKTMGLEIAEQLNWKLPDFIIYPTGGGAGLIGIWKAFAELMAFGWLPEDVKLPKMVAVQSSVCTPVYDAFYMRNVQRTHYRQSVANGISVPIVFAIDLILKVLHESKGLVELVSEQQIVEGIREVALSEGFLLSPEGAATWEACKKLRNKGIIKESDQVLILNTGNGYKYLENMS